MCNCAEMTAKVAVPQQHSTFHSIPEIRMSLHFSRSKFKAKTFNSMSAPPKFDYT